MILPAQEVNEDRLARAIKAFLDSAGEDFVAMLFRRRQHVLDQLILAQGYDTNTAFALLSSAQVEARVLEEMARDFREFVFGMDTPLPGTVEEYLTEVIET